MQEVWVGDGEGVGDSVVGGIVGDSVVGGIVGDSVVGDVVGEIVVGDVVGDNVVGDVVGDNVVGDVVGSLLGFSVRVTVGLAVDGLTVGAAVGAYCDAQ